MDEEFNGQGHEFVSGGFAMKESMERAEKVLKEWKSDSYTFGQDVLDVTGKVAKKYGKKVLFVVTELGQGWIEKPLDQVKSSLKAMGLPLKRSMARGQTPLVRTSTASASR